MRRQRWDSFERMVTDDLNDISLEIYKDIQDGLVQALGSATAFFIADGFKPVRVNSTTVTVAAGRGYGTLTSADAEEPLFGAFVKDSLQTFTITPEATLNRIDLLVVSRVVTEITESRDIRTSPGATVTPTNIVKKRRESSLVTRIAGTPGGLPAVPSYDPLTQVVICQMYVAGSGGGVSTNDFYDMRRKAYLPTDEIRVRNSAAGSLPVTLRGQAASVAYNLDLPLAAPSATDQMIAYTSGAVGSFKTLTDLWASANSPRAQGGAGLLPLGAVIATFPALTGAYDCVATTAADANGFVKCNGQTIVDGTSAMNGVVIPNINNSVFLMGATTSNTSGGANTRTLTSTELPAHTHTTANIPTAAHTHTMAHVHQTMYKGGLGLQTAYAPLSRASATLSFTTSGASQAFFEGAAIGASGASSLLVALQNGVTNYNMYTAGATDDSGSAAISGAASATSTLTSASTGTGSSFDIRPSYISALYIMRIK